MGSSAMVSGGLSTANYNQSVIHATISTPRKNCSTIRGASIREARALLAAAGYRNGINGLDYMVRDIAIFKLWSQAI
jgi:hypothetical protein